MVDWGLPPWRAAVPLPERSLPSEVEVAIVGAGFTGLAVAFELARRGVSVHVLEATRLGAGASGHTGAIALEGTAAGPLADADTCLESLSRMVERAAIDCDLRLGGCWEVAHTEPPGGPPFWRDGERALAVVDTVPGGTLDAGRLLTGLARAALARGAAIHEASPVLGVDPVARRLDLGSRTVTARTIVLALNAYTPTLLRLPLELTPALTLAHATEPLDAATLDAIGLAAHPPFYTVDLPYLWGRVLADGRLVLGAGLVFPEGVDVRRVGIDQPESVAAFASLERRTRGLHPALARVRIDSRWGGPISFRAARTPLLGVHPDGADVVVTGACAGHGVALSARIGELVTEHVTSGRALPAWGALV